MARPRCDGGVGPAFIGEKIPLQHLQFLSVKRHDRVGIVGEEDVVGNPGGGSFGGDHRAKLAAEIAPEFGVEKNVGHARPDAEFQVAQLDADFLQRADATDIEDTKIRRLEPLLPEVARRFLKGIEEIYAEFRWLGFEFEEAGARQCAFAPGLVGREAHHAAPAPGQDAQIRAHESRELVD